MKNYNCAFKSYQQVAYNLRFEVLLPFNIQYIAMWLAYITDEIGLKISSIRNYMSGLTSIHEMMGFNGPNNPMQNKLIKLVFQGIERYQSSIGNNIKRVRKEITFDILEQFGVLLNCKSSILFQACLWAAFHTGIAACLRPSEYTIKNKTDDRLLTMNSIKFYNTNDQLMNSYIIDFNNNNLLKQIDYYKIRLSKSKTDSLCQGVDCIIPYTDSTLAMINYLRIRFIMGLDCKFTSNTPLFIIDKNYQPLSQYTLIQEMRKLLKQMGLNPLEYSGHSIRRGGTTSLKASGVSDSTIKTIGRWKSNCFEKYINLADRDIINEIRNNKAN